MQFSPILLASAFAILGTLFWLLLFAAIVWLLIWLLLRSNEEDSDRTSSDSDSDAAETSSGETVADASSAPEQEPATGPPSRAFTIWTHPLPKAEEPEAKEDEEDSASEPELETASAKEAAAQFKADLKSGIARQDEALGILYDSAPDDADDLKKIKGVAKVLEGKLQGFGIYKYKQIAFWTETAMAEFAERLTFKDRIYRDNWIAQAKGLHEEKYGEKF